MVRNAREQRSWIGVGTGKGLCLLQPYCEEYKRAAIVDRGRERDEPGARQVALPLATLWWGIKGELLPGMIRGKKLAILFASLLDQVFNKDISGITFCCASALGEALIMDGLEMPEAFSASLAKWKGF